MTLLAILGITLLAFVAQGLYRNRGGVFDALPPYLNTPAKWTGTDLDTPWFRWDLKIKGWFAFGPWSKYSWARWTFPPKVLFKVGGEGPWRYEKIRFGIDPYTTGEFEVLSRCQYYKRWALTVQWPLTVTFHVYWRAKDVPVEGVNWTNNFGIKKLLFMYGPIHFDADLVYWIFSFFIGGQWK